MDTLALTDRDGTYGAVKHARACRAAGLRPVLGVDLAVTPLTGEASRPTLQRPRTPVRGGAFRDDRALPRVTFLADAGAAGGRAGWAAICRLVSATQLAGERGKPVVDLSVVAPWLESGDVTVLLGPASEVGAALARPGRAGRRPGPGGAGAVARGRPADQPPRRAGLPPVARPATGPAPSGVRAPPPTPPGWPASPARPDWARCSPTRCATPTAATPRSSTSSTPPAGWSPSTGATSTAATPRASSSPASRCTRWPRRSPGWPGSATPTARPSGCWPTPGRSPTGAPSTRVPTSAWARSTSRSSTSRPPSRPACDRPRPPAHPPTTCSAARCEAGIGHRYGSAPRQRIWKRLDDELEMIRGLGYASYFLTVGDVTDLIRDLGVRAAARGSGAGSLVNYLLGVSGVDPIRHGLLMERFLSPLRASLPDIDVDVESARRDEIYRAILDRYGGERCVCVSMMDTYRVRHAVRDVGAALGMPPGETDTIAKAFPHIRARDARMAMRDLPELRAARARPRAARPDVRPRRAARRAAPPHRRPPVRGAAVRRHAARPDAGRVQLRRLPDEPVRQGRRRGPRAAQARRARHPDAVLDGPRRRADPPDRRRRDRPRRRAAGAVRRPGDLPHDQPGPHPRGLPDRVTRPARAGRQVRHRDLRRHHHRHLAVPARAGQERHDHALPRGQAGLVAGRPTSTTTCARSSSRPTASWSSTSR